MFNFMHIFLFHKLEEAHVLQDKTKCILDEHMKWPDCIHTQKNRQYFILDYYNNDVVVNTSTKHTNDVNLLLNPTCKNICYTLKVSRDMLSQ